MGVAAVRKQNASSSSVSQLGTLVTSVDEADELCALHSRRRTKLTELKEPIRGESLTESEEIRRNVVEH